MPRIWAVVFFAAVVALSGVAEGLWTGRWAGSGEPERALARLADLPAVLGEWDWDGQVHEPNPRAVALSQVSGYVERHYVNRRTGTGVTALVVCGRPGPVAVHSPEVCYAGAGFEQQGATVSASLPGMDGTGYRVCNFRKQQSGVPVDLRVFYSWSATGAWETPANPRLAFARYPALYKLYLSRRLPTADDPLSEDPSLEFLRVLVPELNKCLFPAS